MASVYEDGRSRFSTRHEQRWAVSVRGAQYQMLRNTNVDNTLQQFDLSMASSYLSSKLRELITIVLLSDAPRYGAQLCYDGFGRRTRVETSW